MHIKRVNRLWFFIKQQLVMFSGKGKYIFCLFPVFCVGEINAQLCTGSLGDPVVKIDFGSGTSTHGSALGSDITSYTWSSLDFPPDGSYTIENSTAGSGSVWWSTTDHTGNTGGYMMVVNANYNLTDYFYKKTVTGLCPGTTYEFAAWVVNLLRSSDLHPPNITFEILSTSGDILNSYTTGTIPLTSSGPIWKQFGFYFTTPTDASSVVIKMINNSLGGAPANDLALDDITFRACGPAVSATMTGGLTSKEVCTGDATDFTLSAIVGSGYTSPSYQWQVSTDTGATWSDINGAVGLTYTRPVSASSTAGTYEYRLTVAEGTNISVSTCRVSSNVITITVDATPQPNASDNSPKCEGDTLKLSASGGATYAWTGPNSFSSNIRYPVINGLTTLNNGKYYVTVTTSLGCTNTDSVTVAVNQIPQANAGTDVTICEGSSTTLLGNGGTSYLWSPSTGLSATNIAEPVASPSDTTVYILAVGNGLCTGYDSVAVNVLKKPVANAGADKKMYEGEAVQLNGTAGGTNVSYYWTPDYNIVTDSILNPVVSPASDTTYTLHVVSNDGCGSATDAVFVRVYKKITIPNAFSPNGDGKNDTWYITAMYTYPEGTVTLFDRNGQIVFHSMGYSKPWDGTYNGKPVPVGTYYYIIDLKNGLARFSGWVFVIR
jgi:gliding motility-associated-like protein